MVSSLFADFEIPQQLAMDVGAVRASLHGLGAGVGFDSGKEAIERFAFDLAFDAERLPVWNNGDRVVFSVHGYRSGDVVRLLLFERCRRELGDDFRPLDEAHMGVLSRAELKRKHDATRHQLVCEVATVCLRRMRCHQRREFHPKPAV
jgi:hypothetical protein